jgi:poly(hydroxyalkanoate) granule-associated protein
MVKKTKSSSSAKASSSASGLLDSQLAGSVKDSAQQIWLAGMGAFSKAQEEGSKVFEALVKEGMSLQKKTQGLAEEKIGEVTGKMSAMADTVSSRAGQNWDKLESIFEARTAKAMAKLGVPTAKDVDTLIKRVDALAAAVAKLGQAKSKSKSKSKSADGKTDGKTGGKSKAATDKSPAMSPPSAPATAPTKRARSAAKSPAKAAGKVAATTRAKAPAKARKSAAKAASAALEAGSAPTPAATKRAPRRKAVAAVAP